MGWHCHSWLKVFRLTKTRGQQSVFKMEKSIVDVYCVAWYLGGYCVRWADAGCYVVFLCHVQEQPQKSEEHLPWYSNIATIIFLWISKTMMCKPANWVHLLYFLCRIIAAPCPIICELSVGRVTCWYVPSSVVWLPPQWKYLVFQVYCWLWGKGLFHLLWAAKSMPWLL